jgi:iron complex outermembrane receptor protein
VQAGRLGLVVAASGSGARDDYPYFDPNAGVTGSMVRRVGADRALGSLFGRVDVTGRARASAALWLGVAERGAPGAAGTAPDQGGRQHDRHVRAWSNLSLPVRSGSATLGGLVQYAELQYVGTTSDDTGRTWLASARAEVSQPIAAWTAVAGVEGAYASARHPALAAGAVEGRASPWAAAAGRLGPVSLFPAVRVDAYLRTGAAALVALSPRLGASMDAGSSITLKASAGSAFRPPTFNDRFWQYAGQSEPAGDPDLRAERGWTSDAGFYVRAGRLTGEATFYLANTRDQIVWLPDDTGLFVPQNLARTSTRGVEVTLEVNRIPLGPTRSTAGLAYALTDARDRSTPGSVAYDRPLRYVARHVASVHTGSATHFAGIAVRLDLQGRITGSRPTRADGGGRLPAHTVADVRLTLGRTIARTLLEVVLAVENATGTRYSIMDGYPMPPRHGTLTLRLTL